MSSFGDRIYQLLGWRKVEPQAMVLFLGLDGSGKSTIISRCAALVTTSIGLDENLETRRNDNQLVEVDTVTGILPTQGYDIKKFSLYDLKILAWDVGGQKSLRHSWRKYYTNSQYVMDALVYVIDSADRRRIAETGIALRQLLDEDKLSGVPLLIFANKQDIPSALTSEQLGAALNLHNIRDRTWKIVPCSAMNKQGIEHGTQFLVQSAKAQMARKNNHTKASSSNAGGGSGSSGVTQT